MKKNFFVKDKEFEKFQNDCGQEIMNIAVKYINTTSLSRLDLIGILEVVKWAIFENKK